MKMTRKVAYLVFAVVFLRALFRYDWGLKTIEHISFGMLFAGILFDAVPRWRR